MDMTRVSKQIARAHIMKIEIDSGVAVQTRAVAQGEDAIHGPAIMRPGNLDDEEENPTVTPDGVRCKSAALAAPKASGRWPLWRNDSTRSRTRSRNGCDSAETRGGYVFSDGHAIERAIDRPDDAACRNGAGRHQKTKLR